MHILPYILSHCYKGFFKRVGVGNDDRTCKSVGLVFIVLRVYSRTRLLLCGEYIIRPWHRFARREERRCIAAVVYGEEPCRSIVKPICI